MKPITWSDNTGSGVLEVTGIQMAREWECPSEIGEGPVEEEGPEKKNSSWSQKVWSRLRSWTRVWEYRYVMARLGWCSPSFWLGTEAESIVETFSLMFIIFKQWTIYEVKNMTYYKH